LPEKSKKLELGENHRRVVSAVLRRVEHTCDEVLEWLERPGGDLLRFEEDLSPGQAAELRAEVSRLREEARRVEEELVVDAAFQSRARAVAASISLTRVELEEVLTPGLRGYGALHPQVEAALDAKFGRLLAHLQTLGAIATRNHARGRRQ
jgi:hypothetical protein